MTLAGITLLSSFDPDKKQLRHKMRGRARVYLCNPPCLPQSTNMYVVDAILARNNSCSRGGVVFSLDPFDL